MHGLTRRLATGTTVVLTAGLFVFGTATGGADTYAESHDGLDADDHPVHTRPRTRVSG